MGKPKKIILLFLFALVGITVLAAGGRTIEKSPEFCGSCHEMESSYKNWKASGAAEDHPNCIMCHSGSGFGGVIEAEFRGIGMIGKHLTGDIDEKIQGKVPENFCFKCHDKPEMDHEHDVKHTINRTDKTCGSCHNHKEGSVFFTDM